jgi:hypothetical protein
MEKLLGKTREELKEIAVSAGLPSFSGGQLADGCTSGKRVLSMR